MAVGIARGVYLENYSSNTMPFNPRDSTNAVNRDNKRI